MWNARIFFSNTVVKNHHLIPREFNKENIEIIKKAICSCKQQGRTCKRARAQ